MFLCIKGEVINRSELFGLSPHCMKWDDDLWVLDLSSTRSYLQRFASIKNMEVLPFIRERVDEIYRHQPYKAVLGENALQAILLLKHMDIQGLDGLVSLSENFSVKLYQKVSWQAFFGICEEILAHLKGAAKVKVQAFKRQTKQFQTMVAKLNLINPRDLRCPDSMAIRRRYGNFMKELWQVAFIQDINENPTAGHCPFYKAVWLDWVESERPVVRNNLDFPLFEWKQIEPLLTKDMERLCEHGAWNREYRLTELQWTMTLFDMTTKTLNVTFRHPHSLHSEAPHFSAALLQCSYSLERDRVKQEQEETNVQPIVGWTLTVLEMTHIQGRQEQLFSEVMIYDETFRDLENKLPCTLENYALQSDWVPEDSYLSASRISQDSFRKSLLSSEEAYSIQPSLEAVASERPLYICSHPEGLSDTLVKKRVFLERTMGKWWLNSGSQRDYFKVVDQKNRRLWVYKNNNDDCYIHGLFA